jgi:hypothetical protein
MRYLRKYHERDCRYLTILQPSTQEEREQEGSSSYQGYVPGTPVLGQFQTCFPSAVGVIECTVYNPKLA